MAKHVRLVGVISAAVLAAVSSAGSVWAQAGGDDLAAQLEALRQQQSQSQRRIEELEGKLQAQERENWMTEERAIQIKAIVQDVLKDAQARGQSADGVETGYKDGFYIQDASKNFKIVFNGLVQVRYEGFIANATNGRTLPGRTVGSGGSAVTVVPDDPANGNGIDIRRARLSVAGNVFTPDLTFKLEGDFYGSATGAFTVTDAFAAYRFNDQVKIRAGSFKVPFAKAELSPDPTLDFMERNEALAPFNPQRSLGVSVFGDFIKDTLSYEVNINNGGNTNTLRRVDTVGLTANLDNRMGYYARVNWAGAGKISELMNEEGDLREK